MLYCPTETVVFEKCSVGPSGFRGRISGFLKHIFLFMFFMPKSVLLTQYCAGGKIEKNEMGGACGAYRGGQRCVQGFGGEA